MDRQEFLEKLRLSLNGRLPAQAVAEHISYYEDYINTEIRKGKSEEEVLGMLGDPRLIARTLVETSSHAEEVDYKDVGREQAGETRRRESGGVEPAMKKYPAWLEKIPGWVWLILVGVVAVLIISAVFHVIAFFAPAILTVGIIIFFVRLFRDWIK